MRFSEFDVTRRTRKGNLLNQIAHLIDWKPIEQAIAQHYAPVSDVTGRPPSISSPIFEATIWSLFAPYI